MAPERDLTQPARSREKALRFLDRLASSVEVLPDGREVVWQYLPLSGSEHATPDVDVDWSQLLPSESERAENAAVLARELAAIEAGRVAYRATLRTYDGAD